MPRIKRWFPVSQDFNDDGELWEFTDMFGDRALRVWLEICAILDKTENRWTVTEGSVKSVARKCRQSFAKVCGMIRWLVAKHWLMVPEGVSSDSPTIYGAPNYWKYHPKVESEKFLLDSLLPSFLPNLPSEEKPKKPSAPVKVKELRPQTEADDLVRLAAEIGQLDKVESRAGTQKALIQWVISMLRKLDKEPPERKQAVARASLEQVRNKLRTGYEIKSIWGLLNKIFDAERTKYMQGPENESFKNAPMGQFGAIMDKIRAGEKQ